MLLVLAVPMWKVSWFPGDTKCTYFSGPWASRNALLEMLICIQGQIHWEAAKLPFSNACLISLHVLQQIWVPLLGTSSVLAPETPPRSAVPLHSNKHVTDVLPEGREPICIFIAVSILQVWKEQEANVRVKAARLTEYTSTVSFLSKAVL